MTTTTTLPTRNETWGFWGTMHLGGNEDTAAAWTIASEAIARATACSSPEGVRDFLDSRHGRHFADEVANGIFRGLPLQEAIDAAITRWMSWKINRRMSRETGIPHGLPYLTGLVAEYAIMAEFPY